MMTIYKNGLTAQVPSGAYKRMFKPYGWTTKPVEPPTEPAKASPEVDPSKTPAEPPEPPKEPQNGSEDLTKLNDQELRQYASLLGVKTKDLKTREEVLGAIAAAQN